MVCSSSQSKHMVLRVSRIRCESEWYEPSGYLPCCFGSSLFISSATIALSKKDYKLVDILIQNGCNINMESQFVTQIGKIHMTPISVSIENDDIVSLEKLIKAGANIHIKARYDNGEECGNLNLAAYACRVDIVNELINHGADPNEESHQSTGIYVPLDSAIRAKKYENAKALINAGANVNYVLTGKDSDYTSLNWTVMTNDVVGFDLLMNSNADPNSMRVSHIGNGRFPALCDAVSEGRYEMVSRLIQAGARKDSVALLNGRRISLIQLAKSNQDLKMLTLLLSYGITGV